MDNDKKRPAGTGPLPVPDGVTIFPAPAAEEKTEQATAETIRQRMAEDAAKVKESLEAMKEGKGVLTLEVPIRAAGKDITELPYDFNKITGLEYVSALDSDRNANPLTSRNVTNLQALYLFATAAAKEAPEMDMTDVVSRIQGTDAAIATFVAKLFFTASIRAGQKRISKK